MKLLRWLFPVLGDLKDTMAGPVMPAPRRTAPEPTATGDYRLIRSVPLADYLDEMTDITLYETPYVIGETTLEVLNPRSR